MRLALSAVVVLVATVASAQDRQSARAAYEAGTEAYKRGDFAAAAARYAEADVAAPSSVALQAALDAAVKADDPVLGAELLDRARTRDVKGALSTSVQAATVKLAHRAGKLTVTCPSTCVVTMDGAAIETGHARWVRAGTHAIAFSIESRNETKSIDVAADAEIIVDAPPPPPPPPVHVEPVTSIVTMPPAPPEQFRVVRRGFSPTVFWVSLATTAASTAGSIVLLAVTKATHDDFASKACSSSTSNACQSLSTQGNVTMVTGDVLLGVSIALAIWTTVAAALTRWHSPVEVAARTVFWRVTF